MHEELVGDWFQPKGRDVSEVQAEPCDYKSKMVQRNSAGDGKKVSYPEGTFQPPDSNFSFISCSTSSYLLDFLIIYLVTCSHIIV